MSTEADIHASIRSEFADDGDFRELLEMFFERVPELQRSLAEARHALDVHEIRTIAHQLKGSGGGYGFPGLSAAAAELELACKAGQLDRVTAGVESLLGYLGRLHD